MPRRVSAKRYAQAMFELAREQNQLDAWAFDLQMVSQALQDPDFRTLLSHADVPVDEKIKASSAVLGEVHPLVLNLVNVLVASGLVNLAPDLQTAYNALLDVHHGRQQVEVTSAVLLDDAELTQITSFVSDLISKEVVVTTRVDESIMGGVVIQIGDQLLDGSTRSRLEALRNRMHSEVIVTGS